MFFVYQLNWSMYGLDSMNKFAEGAGGLAHSHLALFPAVSLCRIIHCWGPWNPHKHNTLQHWGLKWRVGLGCPPKNWKTGCSIMGWREVMISPYFIPHCSPLPMSWNFFYKGLPSSLRESLGCTEGCQEKGKIKQVCFASSFHKLFP